MLGSELRRRRPGATAHPGNESASALRALKILRLLGRRWCRVSALAAAFGVDLKTIRRDLAVIRSAGFRLEVKVEDYGRKAYRAVAGRR